MNDIFCQCVSPNLKCLSHRLLVAMPTLRFVVYSYENRCKDVCCQTQPVALIKSAAFSASGKDKFR